MDRVHATASTDSPNRSMQWAGFLLGFSLGGFFDGILLHQILQWHHLLSNVQAAQDMRVQILADGLFHALMYVVAAIGLYALWKARAGLADRAAGSLLWGQALLGFGIWHIVDSIFSHWITGIHRIRVDSPNPLLWDLIWFVAFGLLPAVLGWRMRKGGGAGPGRKAAAALGLAALVAGPLAALPGDTDGEQVLVLFKPGVSGGAAFNALAQVQARVLWVDRAGGTWAVVLPDRAQAGTLYRHGALLVSGRAAALGCIGWTKAIT